MRIYYPINNEEPTPALPKGGSMNEAQYSLTSNRLSLPSRGEGVLCSFVLLSEIKGRLLSPLPWGGAGVGVSYAPNGALICQPRATPGELDAAGIRPRRGQKNDSPTIESGKGSEWNNNSFAHSGRMLVANYSQGVALG